MTHAPKPGNPPPDDDDDEEEEAPERPKTQAMMGIPDFLEDGDDEAEPDPPAAPLDPRD